jgi:hypothetical protein
MKKSEFHLKKEMLQIEISMQEKLLEEKFQTVINPQSLLITVLPSVAKRFLKFEGKELSTSFAEKINQIAINVLVEAQKVIGGVSHIIAVFRDLKEILKTKKASTL